MPPTTPGWNATFTNVPYLSAAFLNMFIDAFNERVATIPAAAFGGATPPISGALAHITAGQAFPPHDYSDLIAALQNLAGADAPFGGGSGLDWFIRPSFTFAGQAFGGVAAGALWSRDDLYTAASVPAGATVRCLTRKRYREILALTDTADVQGNTATTGQYALLITAGGVSPWCVYKFNGTAWASAGPAHDADVLSTVSAAPNAITVDANGGAMTDGTPMQPGDIIGDWLFTELRNIYNLLTVTMQGAPFDSSTYTFKIALSLTSRADAESRWASGPLETANPITGYGPVDPQNPDSSNSPVGTFAEDNPSGDSYLLYRAEAKPAVTLLGVAGQAPSVEFYAFTVGPSNSPPYSDFDTQGDSLPTTGAGFTAQLNDVGGNASPTPQSTLQGSMLGDTTGGQPTWAAASPGDSGWLILPLGGLPGLYATDPNAAWYDVITRQDWGVAGGFVYRG